MRGENIHEVDSHDKHIPRSFSMTGLEGFLAVPPGVRARPVAPSPSIVRVRLVAR